MVTGTLVSGAVRKGAGGGALSRRPAPARARRAGSTAPRPSRPWRDSAPRSTSPTSSPPKSQRGDVLASPGAFAPCTTLDCRLDLLPSAKPLKHRAPVHFHAGTAEIEAEVRLLAARRALQPGQRAYARIVLREPALLLPGDRFIIRMFSPVVTIGGGVVVDTGRRPLPQGRRRRRAASDAGRSTCGRAHRAAGARSRIRHGHRPNWSRAPDCCEREIAAARRSGPCCTRAAAALVRRSRLVPGGPRAAACAPCANFTGRIRCCPASPSRICAAASCRTRRRSSWTRCWRDAKELVVEGETVRLRATRVVLKEDEEQARAADRSAPSSRPGWPCPRWRRCWRNPASKRRAPVRCADPAARETPGARSVTTWFPPLGHRKAARPCWPPTKAQRFNVGAFKEWTGISRKYAIPLLEFLDREHVTRREGDERLVL